LDVVLKRNEINGAVIVALSNSAYKNITLNWIGSLVRQNYTRFVVFSFDEQLATFLAERGFGSSVAIVPPGWLGTYKDRSKGEIADWRHNLNVLRNMVRVRASFWKVLLHYDVTFLFSDLDLVLLSPHLIEYVQFVFKNTVSEILFTQDPLNLRTRYFYNTGFFYASPTPFVKKLFAELVDYLGQKPEIDQIGLQNMIDVRYRNDKRIGVFDHLLFPNAYIYSKHRLNEKWAIQPLMYHTNYFLNIKEKLDSFRHEGYWFLDNEGNLAC
jgi:hypothetical protein